MKDITVLRNHLFEQLNRLAEAAPEELEIEVTRAASVVQVADAIIRTAQIENQFLAITKATGSGFIPIIEPQKKIPESNPDNIGLINQEFFNPDDEKNWLTADPGKPQ